MLAPIYRVYEHRLLQQVRAFPVPRHIGLILDGNRRFGRLNGLRHPDDIYMAGANKLDDLLDWCIDLEIPVITLWVFSTEIRKRPAQEVTGAFLLQWRRSSSLRI
jgi:short-chain Z-isoprenyl diphosphate synthase